MDKSDIAGILGLLLGGAGGYYGGKKRSEREEQKLADYFDMMKELQGGGKETTSPVSIADLGTNIIHPGKEYQNFDTFVNPDAIDVTGVVPETEEGFLSKIFGGNEFDSGYVTDYGVERDPVVLEKMLEDNTDLTDQELKAYYDNFQMFNFNEGGRVGLANGGLGYSYKNNIFSADPSLTRPVVVDEGDDGVADDTFINLFPGLFPPIGDPVEKIMDTPAVPMGGGGGGENNPFSNNYTGDPNIPFGENPMYGPSSGYDPDNPENSFLDKLGYSFYSNVALPTATMMKKNPFSIANILSSVFGDKDNDKGDPDPKGEPGPGVEGAGTDGTGGPDSQYGGDGKGEGKGFGGANVGDHSPGKGTSRF